MHEGAYTLYYTWEPLEELASGDPDLLKLDPFAGFPAVTPKTFLQM